MPSTRRHGDDCTIVFPLNPRASALRLTCALPSRRLVVVLKEIFLAAPDGGGLFYDLLPLQLGGTQVSATAARIATHAYAMPPATQPAVTQASQTLFGCRVLAGQVRCDEDARGGGLRAGRVAVERPESLSLVESSLVDYEESAQPKHILMTS